MIVALLAEEIIVDRGLVKLMDSSFWLTLRPRKEKYRDVEKELKLYSDWPPLRNDSPSLTTLVAHNGQ